MGEPLLDPTAWNVKVLARRWALARPFPHLVIDHSIDETGLDALGEALAEAEAQRIVSDIYEVMATGHLDEPTMPEVLQQLAATLGSDAMLSTLGLIAGKRLGGAVARGYAFHKGHYLLPHHDQRDDRARSLAFALYVATSDDLAGGELELFECAFAEDRDEVEAIVATDPVGKIRPERGRLVLFDVSNASLHQVCEVTRGLRVSISGWFLRGS